ncbi:UNVERIFIED_ORG: hypothetical protein FNL38_104258 [Nocardia globerula]|uniref:Uncharacterized protein n=1 Tax=Nocardia globerula TaxID=1818 RepID=A0A652YP46_NOCGL|nr:hypothetical protein C8E04_5709 [Rhodococcus globerulus]
MHFTMPRSSDVSDTRIFITEVTASAYCLQRKIIRYNSFEVSSVDRAEEEVDAFAHLQSQYPRSPRLSALPEYEGKSSTPMARPLPKSCEDHRKPQ